MYRTNRFRFLFRKSVFDRFRPFSSLGTSNRPGKSQPERILQASSSAEKLLGQIFQRLQGCVATKLMPPPTRALESSKARVRSGTFFLFPKQARPYGGGILCDGRGPRPVRGQAHVYKTFTPSTSAQMKTRKVPAGPRSKKTAPVP
jgi:hypothetical protein